MSMPVTFEVEVDTDTVSVEVETPEIEVEVNPDKTVVFAVIPLEGPQGPAGAMFEGVAWFYGEGPPDPSPEGAKVDDLYLDVLTGLVYKLGA